MFRYLFRDCVVDAGFARGVPFRVGDIRVSLRNPYVEDADGLERVLAVGIEQRCVVGVVYWRKRCVGLVES